MSNIIEVVVPDIGDDGEVDVIELLVAVGDTVEVDQSLITVESDKASMEIPSSHAGVVTALKVNIGDKVKQGSLILEIDAAAQDSAKQEEPAENEAAKEAKVAEADTEKAEQAPAKEAKAAPAATEEPVTVRVPDIGDAHDVDVIEVLVSVGDTVEADQSLITLETEKASMEVPSSHAGVITAISVKVGDTVSQGSDILELRVSASAAPAPEKQSDDVAAAPKTEKAAPAVVSSEAGVAASESPVRESPTSAFAEADVPLRNLPHASPSVRLFARELGVNLSLVSGSGAKGRITPDDVRKYVKEALAKGAGSASAAPTGGVGVGSRYWRGLRSISAVLVSSRRNRFRVSRKFQALTCIVTGS